jgi:hypothetical protein
MTGLSRLRAVMPLLLDLVIPAGGYFLLHAAGVSDFWALTVAGSVTALNAVLNTVRRRRLDALGLLVIAELGLTLVLMVATHDPRLVLVRPAFYLALAALWALATCFVGKPVTYVGATPMATKGDPERMRAYERVWDHSPRFQRVHRQLTAIVAVALLCYAILRVAIVYTLTVPQAVVSQEVLGVVLLGGLIVVIRSRVPQLRRIVDDEQAKSATDVSPATG